jgi:hypothetical protein
MRASGFVLLAALVAGAMPRTQPPIAITTLAVPDRANEHVSLAASGQLVVAVWAATVPEQGSDVFAAVSRDAGASFARPVRVNQRQGEAKANGEQPPRVAISRKDNRVSMVVAWTASAAGGTRVMSAESRDEGNTFDAATTIAEAAGSRGWESLAIDRDGRALVLWLDHRETALTAASHEHQGHEPGTAAAAVARAQLSKLMIAGVPLGANKGRAEFTRTLTGGVCYCCKTALTTGGDGSVFAAWRHVFPGNHRDIAFTVSRDGGKTFASPTRVSDDSWELNGCPENGPAIAADTRGRVHVVWPTLVDGPGEPHLGLFWAVSRDGRTFSPRQQIATDGQPFHPQLAVDRDGSLIVAWDQVVNARRQVYLARGTVNDDGSTRFTRLGAPSIGAYPAIAISDSGPVVAWTNRSASPAVIAVARLPLP